MSGHARLQGFKKSLIVGDEPSAYPYLLLLVGSLLLHLNLITFHCSDSESEQYELMVSSSQESGVVLVRLFSYVSSLFPAGLGEAVMGPPRWLDDSG